MQVLFSVRVDERADAVCFAADALVERIDTDDGPALNVTVPRDMFPFHPDIVLAVGVVELEPRREWRAFSVAASSKEVLIECLPAEEAREVDRPYKMNGPVRA